MRLSLQFEDNACVCVILASDGYPENYEKGKVDQQVLRILKAGMVIMYSMQAQSLMRDNIVTNGGRVLGITAKGKT